MGDLKLSTRKQLLFSLIVVSLFFGGLELVLAILGVRPVRHVEDPFVGFAAKIPLYVEETAADGTSVMATARNKLRFFNPQRFPKRKRAGAYRIFCVGGSTTFGSPYRDEVSFPGWLRELLPVADPTRKWEVINAGGISYASYRVALLMDELSRYDPDLFVVYSGHNEFLEERTYRGVREMPVWIASLHGLLSHTRVYAAGRWLLGRATSVPRAGAGRERLDAEVNTILDRSVGPSAYSRDDALRARVIEHYRISLERIVDIARGAGADVLFVTPASNLGACSPFKSEHRAGLSQPDRQRVDALLAEAQARQARGALLEALEATRSAEALDDRFAATLYLKGRILSDLGRHAEARAAFVGARDEDVCPLRAPSPIVDAMREVAARQRVGLVDFIELVERHSPHGIAGAGLFIDHVHPTIQGNGLLARALVGALAERGVVRPIPSWNESAVEAVGRRIEERVTPEMRAFALNHLSLLFGWAGKFEESARLAEEALRVAPEHVAILHRAGINAHRAGRREEAAAYFRRVLELEPSHPDTHNRLGVVLAELGQLDAAIEHLREEVRLRPDSARGHFDLAVALARQGQRQEATAEYRAALRLDPGTAAAHHNLAVLAFEEGRIEDAAKHCLEAIRIQPDLLPARWLLGQARAGQGRLSDAVAVYEEGVRQAPRATAQAYLELGRLLARGGDRANALSFLRRSEQAEGGMPDLACQLAEAYRESGSADDARRALARCSGSP